MVCAILRNGNKEKFVCNYFEFRPVVQEAMSFLRFFSYFSSGRHFIYKSRTICTILVEGIMRNICNKKCHSHVTNAPKGIGQA